MVDGNPGSSLGSSEPICKRATRRRTACVAAMMRERLKERHASVELPTLTGGRVADVVRSAGRVDCRPLSRRCRRPLHPCATYHLRKTFASGPPEPSLLVIPLRSCAFPTIRGSGGSRRIGIDYPMPDNPRVPSRVLARASGRYGPSAARPKQVLRCSGPATESQVIQGS